MTPNLRDELAQLRQRLGVAVAAERHDAAAAEAQQDVIEGLVEREHRLEAQAKHVDHRYALPRFGVDYSFARPNAIALRHAGATFAVRYLTGEGKAASRAELSELARAGLDVAIVFESDGRTLGAAKGHAEAQVARAAAAKLGVPPDRPIYFACDFDAAGEGLVGEVLAYLAGVEGVLGYHRTGVYGGFDVVEAAHAHYTAAYRWQTLAWSAGRWSAHAQLRQIAVDRVVAGADCDLDEAMAADFGQWRAAA